MYMSNTVAELTRTFACTTCYDTATIDQGGAEVECPACSPITVKITGLSHGLGYKGAEYWCAAEYTSTTITFRGSRGAIRHNVAEVRSAAEREAKRQGLRGRNWISSGPLSIEAHVRKALAA